MNFKQRIKQHISNNRGQYIIISLIFIAGIIAGDYKAAGLDGGVKNHLTSLIDNFLQGGYRPEVDVQILMVNAFLNQARTIVLIWFLGLTVIGIPLILFIVFLKGFSLGFTIGFLVQEKASAGLVISLFSILPQNIVYIPFIIIWAVIAVNFSVYIVKGRQIPEGMNLGTALLSYTVLMLLFIVVFFLGACIETYLSPWFLSLFV